MNRNNYEFLTKTVTDFDSYATEEEVERRNEHFRRGIYQRYDRALKECSRRHCSKPKK